jgi:hypothetical protein
MLRDRAAPVDLFALLPALAVGFEPELAEIGSGCFTTIDSFSASRLT